jgi:hypothetical protein
MPLWFHGTIEENVESILQEGFRIGTYFARHLENAIHMGGEYVFEVFFEKDPGSGWQACNFDEIVSPSDIHSLILYEPTLLHWNQNVPPRLAAARFEREHPGDTVCKTCEGRGQLESYPPLTRWRDMKKITVCEDCGGEGSPEKMKRRRNENGIRS